MASLLGEQHDRSAVALRTLDPAARGAPFDGVVHRNAFALGPLDELRHREFAVRRGQLSRRANLRQARGDQSSGTFADHHFVPLPLRDVKEITCRRLKSCRRDLRLVDPRQFDDSAELNRAVIPHRLPDGVGGLVQEHFFGHRRFAERVGATRRK